MVEINVDKMLNHLYTNIYLFCQCYFRIKKMFLMRTLIQYSCILLFLQFLVCGGDEMNLSTKKGKAEKSSTKSIESANLPCIAYLSTKTGNILPSGLVGKLKHYTNDLFLLNYNSKPEINLTENPTFFSRNQVWSPDGKILAWTSEKRQLAFFENGQKDILVPSSEYSVHLFAWSPGSDRIAFVGYKRKDRKPSNHGIYILKISEKSISQVFKIEFSKDISKLYWVNNFLVWCNLNGTVEKLNIVDSKPKGSPKIIFSQKNARCLNIAVSPDNNALAGRVNNQNRHGIWIFDLDGKNTHKLIKGEDFYESCAAWHPTDCNLLAFSSRVPGKQGYLALYDFNKSKLTNIDLKSNYKFIYANTWTKDGRYIVVDCVRKDIDNQSSDILMYDMENSQWINITDSKDSRDFNPVCRP